jgi:hypothetical protein
VPFAKQARVFVAVPSVVSPPIACPSVECQNVIGWFSPPAHRRLERVSVQSGGDLRIALRVCSLVFGSLFRAES